MNRFYLGKSGRFNVNAPYDTLVKSNVVYKVTADSFITELIRDRKKLFETTYKIIGLTKEVFEEDLANDVVILTLVDSAGDTVYIPEYRVQGGCIRDGVEYVERTLLINIGGFPVNTDFTAMMSNVSDVIESNIGVTPVYELANTSIVEMVSNAEHTDLTNARGAVETDNNLKKLNDAIAEIVRLNKTISDLECIIKEKVIL